MDPKPSKGARFLVVIGSLKPTKALAQSSVSALLNILVPDGDIHVSNERHETRGKAKNCIKTNSVLTIQPPVSSVNPKPV